MEEKRIVLRTSELSHTYSSEEKISFPDMITEKGKHLLISGRSGVGKTTLLHLLGGLTSVQSGRIWIEEQEMSSMSKSKRDAFRGKHIGFVFQQASFIQSLNVLDNVLASQYFGAKKVNRDFALSLLAELGIAGYAKKKTNELSGGERQRLAIARALSTSPDVVLADEPTSSLDDANAMKVLDLLVSEAEQNGATLVIVTHDNRLKSKFENQVEL
ncbi:MAG TPA: ATP-binding cassette domain-containing protein [Cryomorphaceae bacterium]|nr:ATP-binding cassette domain-containing protein [Cryomorphaceae bacterium]